MPPIRQTTPRRSASNQSARGAPASRIENVRAGIQQLFSGRSSVGTRSSSPESPKTPRLALGLNNLSSTRLNIPFLTRTNTADRSPTSPSSPSARSPTTPISSRPITPNALREHELSNISTIPPPIRHNSNQRFVGVDPAERQLAELAYIGRRRRNRTSKERRCAPKIKNQKIRANILKCFISGMFLTLILTIYLALALSNRNESQEFHVLLILIILITTIFFCHALIRLCMMIVRPPAEVDLEQQLPAMIGPGGYANPTTPIRVALARDEEAAGIESEATKVPPPAYGLWRESVRVDPNRLYWQRNEAALNRQNSRSERPQTANRPPSYISEDGVDYVIEAQPRSIAPTTDVPLPPHPSERGRGWPSP